MLGGVLADGRRDERRQLRCEDGGERLRASSFRSRAFNSADNTPTHPSLGDQRNDEGAVRRDVSRYGSNFGRPIGWRRCGVVRVAVNAAHPHDGAVVAQPWDRRRHEPLPA